MNGSILFVGTRRPWMEEAAEIDAARATGQRLVVIRLPGDRMARSPHYDEFRVAGSTVEEQEAAALAQLRVAGVAPSGVVAWTDKHLRLAGRIAHRLGLPASPSRAIEIAQDKGALRHLLDDLAPDANPPYCIIDAAGELVRAARSIASPVFVKPVAGSGGKGIAHVATPAAAARAAELLGAVGPLVVEAEVEGSEHSAAGIVRDGRVLVFGITDKKVIRTLPYQYENVFPSALDPGVQASARALARDVVAAIGLDCTGFHVDFIVARDGIKVLEVGGRLGGECINSHLIPAATRDTRPYQLLLDVVTGRSAELPDQCEITRRTGIRKIFARGEHARPREPVDLQAAASDGARVFDLRDNDLVFEDVSGRSRVTELAYVMLEGSPHDDLSRRLAALAAGLVATWGWDT